MLHFLLSNIIPIIPRGFLTAPIFHPHPNSPRESTHKEKMISTLTVALDMRHKASIAKPLFTNLSLVDNLFLIASQAINSHLGTAFKNQIICHQATISL